MSLRNTLGRLASRIAAIQACVKPARATRAGVRRAMARLGGELPVWIRLAAVDLARHRRRSAFALAIIAICTAATLAVAGYIIATFTAVREATIHGGTGHLQIANAGEFWDYENELLEYGITPEQLATVQRVVRSSQQVDYAMPRLSFQGLVSSGERSVAMLAEGIDPVLERRLSANYVPLLSGETLRDPGGLPAGDASSAAPLGQALIGNEMARLLRVAPGDVITLLVTTVGGGLNAIDVQVAGIFSTGTPELDRMRVLVPLALAQELLRTNRVRRMVVALHDTAQTEHARQELANRLPDFVVRTWRELSPFYGQLVALYSRQVAVLGVVMATIVLLAVFSSVAMGVMERTRDIGTMMSLGIPAARIRRMFLIGGAMLGGLGGAVGVILGLLICTLVNSMEVRMPPPPGQSESYPLFLAQDGRVAFFTLVTMIVLALAASWLASRRVTSYSIVDAIRKG